MKIDFLHAGFVSAHTWHKPVIRKKCVQKWGLLWFILLVKWQKCYINISISYIFYQLHIIYINSYSFKFRDFFTFSRKTLIVSRFLVYFYIKNLFFIFQSSLNKPIINRIFALCNYFLEQRNLAIIWRRFLYILPFFYSNLGIF